MNLKDQVFCNYFLCMTLVKNLMKVQSKLEAFG